MKVGTQENHSKAYLMYSFIAIVCMVCYYNSFYCDFVFDDISAIKENKDLRPHVPISNLFVNDFWGTPMQKEQSHKSYRPLCVLTFRLNYYFNQLEPYGYHLVNVILHIVVCLLYFRTCCLFISELFSFIAAILFAVHPIHTEAVTGIVGRAETLSSIFFLLAFIMYAKAVKRKKHLDYTSLACSMMSIAAAMLSKEQGITVAGICVIYELVVIQKMKVRDMLMTIKSFAANEPYHYVSWPVEATKRICAVIGTTFSLLALRLTVMGSRLPVFTRFDNPASVADWPTRYMTYNYLVSVNVWLLLFPCDLCCDWTMGTIPLVEHIWDKRNASTLITYAVVALMLYVSQVSENRQQSIVITMGLSFLVLPFLPASNLFFPVGFVIAERVLYMPSMGFCLLIAYGFEQLIEKSRNHGLGWFAICLLVLTHGLKTHNRNFDWKDEYTIFMSGLKVNQRNAKLFNNVGHALEGKQDFQEALRYFQKAVHIQPDDIGAHINVGRTYNHLKMVKDAESAYLRAKELLPKAKPGESYNARIAPNHLNVFLNLANLISKNESRLEEADQLYRQAIQMRSDYVQAYINRGDVLLKLNKTKEAQDVYERALFYDNRNADIYYNLGVVLLEQGKPSQALAYLNKALDMDPEHEHALFNSAVILQEMGREDLRSLARQRLMKLMQKDESNEKVYFNLGMLAMDDADVPWAEHWFKKAITLKEDFRSALFNLALMLSDDKRPLEAAPYLKQLVRHHPDHVKGLLLLADIYVNTIKDLDSAEKCYVKIRSIDPGNVQGLHNLCVVYVERGDLKKAEGCLKEAYKMAPTEEYILRHLRIVQTRLKKSNSVPNNTSSPVSNEEDKLVKEKLENSAFISPKAEVIQSCIPDGKLPAGERITLPNKKINKKVTPTSLS